MKRALFATAFVFVLVLGLRAQSVTPQSQDQFATAPAAAVLTYRTAESYPMTTLQADRRPAFDVRFIARTVEIKIGSAVIVADVADIKTMTDAAGVSEVELRGTVRLRSTLSVKPN